MRDWLWFSDFNSKKSDIPQNPHHNYVMGIFFGFQLGKLNRFASLFCGLKGGIVYF